MYHKTWSRIVCIGCLLAFVGFMHPLHAQTQTPITFSGVAGNQHLVIDDRVEGCYGSAHYVFEYTPTPTPQIAVTGPGRDRYRTIQELGSSPLSLNQLVLLDHLLTYYRKHDKQGGCTTQCFITVSLMAGDTILDKESYVDGTGSVEVVASATPAERKELRIADAPLISLDDIIGSILDKRPTIEPNKFPSAFASNANQSYADEALSAERQIDAGNRLSPKTLAEMPGYNQLIKYFTVEDRKSGLIDVDTGVYFLDLEAKPPSLPNSVEWFDTLQHQVPQYDAIQFLKIYLLASKVIASNWWLSNWKHSGPGRFIELEAYNDQPNAMAVLKGDVGLHAWHEAGLRGEPRYEFFLRRPGKDSDYYSASTIFFGDADSRGLITQATPASPSETHNWLDRLKVSYSEKDTVPDYVVVARDGRWWRNQRPCLSRK